jgi:hypothetical protein
MSSIANASSENMGTRKNLMKYTKILLLYVLILTSCVSPSTTESLPVKSSTIEPNVAHTLTSTPTFLPTSTFLPTQTITPSPTQIGGGSGKLIFSYKESEFLSSFPDLHGKVHLFIADSDGTDVTPISSGMDGYNYFLGISPDGTKVLMTSTSTQNNRDASLYLVSLVSLETKPIKIADGLPNQYGFNSAAKWIDNTFFVYIGKGEDGFGIYRVNADDPNPVIMYKYKNDGENNRPFEILAISDTRIFWDTLVRTRYLNGWTDRYNIWWTDLNGTERNPLIFNKQQMFLGGIYGVHLAFSPDGTKIAWTEPFTPAFHHNYLHISSVSDIDNPQTLEPLTQDSLLKWFPDNSKILVYDEFSVSMKDSFTWDANSDLFGLYVVNLNPSISVRNEHRSDVLDILIPLDSRGYNKSCNKSKLGNISPDGRILISIYLDHDCKPSKVNFLNLETMTFSELSTEVAPNEVYWVP